MDVTPEHMLEAARRYRDDGWPAVAHGWAVWVCGLDAWEITGPVIETPGRLIALHEPRKLIEKRIELPPTRVPGGELSWLCPP